jgi:uncharacterized protein (TIGR03437 family)
MFSINRALTWGLLTISLCASAQNSAPTAIQSISVCSATGLGGAGSWPSGEFQFNVVLPSSLADGDRTVVATYNGMSTQSGTLITVHQ